MKLLNRTLLLALLLTLPLSAADPLYGVWKTRPSGKPGDTSKQTMTIEPVADGIKFTTDIDFGSGQEECPRRTSRSWMARKCPSIRPAKS